MLQVQVSRCRCRCENVVTGPPGNGRAKWTPGFNSLRDMWRDNSSRNMQRKIRCWHQPDEKGLAIARKWVYILPLICEQCIVLQYTVHNEAIKLNSFLNSFLNVGFFRIGKYRRVATIRGDLDHQLPSEGVPIERMFFPDLPIGCEWKV